MSRLEWGRIGVRLVLTALVLGGAYAALAWWTGQQMPSQVLVDGVSVGGLSPEQATERLTKELSAKATAPVTVELGTTGTSISVDPAAAGMHLDIPGTIEGLSGFTLDPSKIWARLTGKVDRPVRTVVDLDKLTAVVTEKAAAVATQPKEGSVSLTDGKITSTPASPGLKLDVADAVHKVEQAWPRVASVTADTTVTQPQVGQAAIDAAVRDFATPALSAPVTIVVGDKTATISPEQYAGAVTMVADAGKLVPKFDKDALRQAVVKATSAMVTPAKDATIVLQGSTPTVVPAVPGVAVDAAPAPDLLIAAMTAPDRKFTLNTTTAQPSLTTDGAAALGVKEIVSSFDSAFPTDPNRTTNLTVASNTINGTLIKPGETFSMNGVLGERTTAKGYLEGNFIADGGRLQKTVGGGVSQVSTVIYNLSWFAGVQLVEHKAHSFYISRYPAGREATVSWPDLDNKWKNTSPYGILMQMWVSGGQVHGRMWSTKWVDVTANPGPRTNPRTPQTFTDASPTCVPMSAVPGFDITVQRVISQGGKVIKTENYSTSYLPENAVQCTGPTHS